MEKFISEPVHPVPGTFNAALMSAGTPGLPEEFFWRDKKYTIRELLKVWRTTGPCHHGSDEQYIRRYWFEIQTASGEKMKLYFDKGSRGRREEMGWHLFSVETANPR